MPIIYLRDRLGKGKRGIRAMESSQAEKGEVIRESLYSELSDDGGEKPLILRVKRKLSQSPLEALWIEINERPVKRPLLDFQKLSIASSSTVVKEEESKAKRVLVQHVETVGSSEATIQFLNSFVEASPEGEGDPKFTASSKQRRRTLLPHRVQDSLLKAKQHHQELAKNARFEQIWKRRKEDNESIHNEALGEICHVYDVLRVDAEETYTTQQKDEISKDDQEALSKFLPLLREFIPGAAEEIESDFSYQASSQEPIDEYVYDLYAVNEKIDEVEASYPFPLVQLDDADYFYDGPDDSDYDTDDSNAENHIWNDYPEEESSEEEEENSEASGSESEENESETESDMSFRSKDPLCDDDMDGNFSVDSHDYEDDDIGDNDGEDR